MASGVRRIFDKGAGNLRIMKIRSKTSPLTISLFFSPKLGEHQNLKKRSSVRICPFLCSNFLPKLQRGDMPQVYMLFYANYTILATQRVGHGTIPPLNTPLGMAIQC